MFQRKVTAGEHIIDQGDDGDNFYVIERFVARQLRYSLLYYLWHELYACIFAWSTAQDIS